VIIQRLDALGVCTNLMNRSEECFKVRRGEGVSVSEKVTLFGGMVTFLFQGQKVIIARSVSLPYPPVDSNRAGWS
jgi:hypothetical protein